MGKKKTDNTIKRPSVYAFERKINISEGIMSQTHWITREEQEPDVLEVINKSVLGVIANISDKDIKNEELVSKKIRSANPQKTDSCSLDFKHDTLRVDYSMKIIGNVGVPSSCSGKEYNDKLQIFVAKYRDEYEYRELAMRYVTNIVNARWLWRNRVGAHKIEVVVFVDDKKYIFDSKKIGLNDFDSDNNDIKEIADKFVQVFTNKKEFITINVTGFAQIGKGAEVFPSQELTIDSNVKGKKLFVYEGSAALHSQKIGNAIRTIDDWYNESEDNGFVKNPIPVEAYGIVKNFNKAYREPKNKCFYELLDDIVINDTEIDEGDKHYVIAMLIRGGVFNGEKEKD